MAKWVASFVPLFMVLLLASLILAALAQPDCQGSVNGNSFDLSPLAGQVLTAIDPYGQRYTYKVCGFVDTPGCQTATDSRPAVCQQDANVNFHACGSQSTATFGPAAGANFQISFTGGENGRSATINFQCDPSATTPAFQYISQGASGIDYTLQVTSQHACPVTSQSPSPSPNPSEKPGPANTCCVYALKTNAAVTKTLCEATCAPAFASYKLIYNYTVQGCDITNCFFRK